MLLSSPISNRHFLKKNKKPLPWENSIPQEYKVLYQRGDQKSPVVLKWTFSGVLSPPPYESEGEGS